MKWNSKCFLVSAVGEGAVVMMVIANVWDGIFRLPERGARRDRWKRVEGPATALPGTAGMTPTHLGCWDIEQALWAHLWKEEEEEWSEESDNVDGWVDRETGWRWWWWWWLWRCALGGVFSLWRWFLLFHYLEHSVSPHIIHLSQYRLVKP